MLTTLYKTNKNSRIQVWSIETNDGKFRTTTGVLDGKMRTSEWTICTPKNVGKSNEVSAKHQAIAEATSKVTKKKESGFYENIDDAGNGKSYIQPQLAHKVCDYGDDMLKNDSIYSQPKLDGIRNIDDGTAPYSRKGKKFVCVDHIHVQTAKLLKYLRDRGIKVVATDGELYNHKFKHDFDKITKLVKKQKPTEANLEEIRRLLEYHIYDLVIPKLKFWRRYKLLKEAIEHCNLPYLVLVETTKVKSEKHLDKLYSKYLKQGYEGQMQRNGNSTYEHDRSVHLLKRKPDNDLEATVLELVEGIGNAVGLAASASCILPNGITFSANVMGTAEVRSEYWRNKDSYIGKIATIKYQNITPKGRLRFPRLLTFRDYE